MLLLSTWLKIMSPSCWIWVGDQNLETPEYFDQKDVIGVSRVSPNSTEPSIETGQHCSGVHFDCHDPAWGFCPKLSGLPFMRRRVISPLGLGGWEILQLDLNKRIRLSFRSARMAGVANIWIVGRRAKLMLGTVNIMKILSVSGLLTLKIETHRTYIIMVAIGSISAVVYSSCPKSSSESCLHRSWKESGTSIFLETVIHILKYMSHFVRRENNTSACANCRHTGGGA